MGGHSWIYSYDDNGNMTGKTSCTDIWTYSWNDENRLVRVQGPGSVDISYSYDSLGRMLTRDDGTLTTLVWDKFDCVKEVTGESETVYHIPEGQVLSFIRDGERYEINTDALRSVRMITDDEGGVVARYEYSGFGAAISVTEDTALTDFPARFVGAAGVRFDTASQLHYMQQRWYSAELGRFISRDPIGLAGSTHRYSYVANNPMKYVDPTGRYAEVTVDANNNVTIVLPLEFYGPGATPDVAAKFKSDIETVWNRDFGKYHVHVDVKWTIPEKIDLSCPPDKTNRIKLLGRGVLDQASVSNHTPNFDPRRKEWNNGVWNINRAGDTRVWGGGKKISSDSAGPHESGHLMGLVKEKGDMLDYDPVTKKSTVRRGYETNLMGEHPFTDLQEWQIEEIVRMNP